MPEYRVRRLVVCTEEVLITAHDPFQASTQVFTDDLVWKLYEEYQPVVFTVHALDGTQLAGVNVAVSLRDGIQQLLDDNYNACGGLGEEELVARLEQLLDTLAPDVKKDPKAPIRG